MICDYCKRSDALLTGPNAAGKYACIDVSDCRAAAAKGERICRCDHPFTMHQTGEGTWTGFCYGTCSNMLDGDEVAHGIASGISPDEPCSCEEPKEA